MTIRQITAEGSRLDVLPHTALGRLTLAQWDAVRTIRSTRAVGEAARVMGISQPAVSKLLRQAEWGLGLSIMVPELRVDHFGEQRSLTCEDLPGEPYVP